MLVLSWTRTLEQPLQNRDSHGLGGNRVLHTGGEHLMEQRCRGHRTALIKGLGCDVDADATGHVRQLRHGRGRVGQPAIDEGLNQGTGRELRPVGAFDILKGSGSRLGGGGQQGVHGLTNLGYDRHGTLLGYMEYDSCMMPQERPLL